MSFVESNSQSPADCCGGRVDVNRVIWLASDSWLKTIPSSVSRQVVGEEMVNSGHWLEIAAWCFSQCFNTFSLVAERFPGP